MSLKSNTETLRQLIYLFFFHLGAVILLTVLTQVGGVAYLLAVALAWRIRGGFLRRAGIFFASFLFLYGAVSTGAYFAAASYGRQPLPCLQTEEAVLAAQSPFYCILNRHYVRNDLHQLTRDLAEHMNKKFPGTVTLTLDGNFPLFDEFSMLPHLSHNDGRKLDLAFYYQDKEGQYLRGETKSPIGYWGFEGEEICVGNYPMCWDMQWFQIFVRDLDLDTERTGAVLKWLYTEGRQQGVEKIFIEPYVAKRLKANSDIVRYQGYNAARHDDHIHFQIK